MKPHRIFIAINLPEDTQEQLLEYKNKWVELPAKWAAPDTLHITLAFLGNTSDQELVDICELLKQVGDTHQKFSLDLTNIEYGPFGKPPRMIWAIVKQSSPLADVQEHIEQILDQRSTKSFSPHLTLAKLNMFKLQHMEIEEIPEIHEQISLSFLVQSIEVMESEMKRSGPQYTIYQSIPLQAD